MNIPLVNLKDFIPTIVLDIKYASDDNFIAAPVEGYNAAKALLMENAAQALANVQNNLSNKKLTLKVFDAYRPQRAVDHFIRWSQDPNDQKNKKAYYPNIDKSNLFDAGYLVKRSSHSRGSTLDLTLAEKKDDGSIHELDMGTRFDFFDTSSWSEATNITKAAMNNRRLLREEMNKEGFTPFKTEWWHFTLQNELFPEEYFDLPIN